MEIHRPSQCPILRAGVAVRGRRLRRRCNRINGSMERRGHVDHRPDRQRTLRGRTDADRRVMPLGIVLSGDIPLRERDRRPGRCTGRRTPGAADHAARFSRRYGGADPQTRLYSVVPVAHVRHPQHRMAAPAIRSSSPGTRPRPGGSRQSARRARSERARGRAPHTDREGPRRIPTCQASSRHVRRHPASGGASTHARGPHVVLHR
jgi:hypothetical protein